jgi:rubrerythrin
MAEMTMDPRRMARHINSLIELDYDAIEAYEAAVARLGDAGDRTQLEGFLGDHRRHVADLAPLVVELGEEPAKQADFKMILAKGKVVLGALAGDRAILEAMKSNEETTTKVYQRAAGEPGLSSRVREVLDRNFADEQRHLAWITRRLATRSQAAEQGRRT